MQKKYASECSWLTPRHWAWETQCCSLLWTLFSLSSDNSLTVLPKAENACLQVEWQGKSLENLSNISFTVKDTCPPLHPFLYCAYDLTQGTDLHCTPHGGTRHFFFFLNVSPSNSNPLNCKDVGSVVFCSHLLVSASGQWTKPQVCASCKQLSILLIEQKYLSECVCAC